MRKIWVAYTLCFYVISSLHLSFFAARCSFNLSTRKDDDDKLSQFSRSIRLFCLSSIAKWHDKVLCGNVEQAIRRVLSSSASKQHRTKHVSSCSCANCKERNGINGFCNTILVERETAKRYTDSTFCNACTKCVCIFYNICNIFCWNCQNRTHTPAAKAEIT